MTNKIIPIQFNPIRAAALILAALVSTAPQAQAAKPAACSNPAVKWEFRSSYTIDIGGIPTPFASRITGDGSPYSGVVNLCSGSGDATLQTGSRGVTFAFGANLAPGGGTITPVSGDTFFNLRNLVFEHFPGERLTEYEFTTWLGSGIPSPKKAKWNFRLFNPAADAAGSIISPADLNTTNTPLVTSEVTVHHCPANLTSTTCLNFPKETWLVYPDPAPATYRVGGAPSAFRNVGALVNSQSALVNLGQFEMPFYFVISIK